MLLYMFNIANLSALFGYCIECFSVSLVVFLIPHFSYLFLPNIFDTTYYLYILNSIGYFVFYPLGCFYYGLMGDRLGRKKMSCHTILGLSFSTLLMAIIPVGTFLTPYIFFVVICTQGFFAAGEHRGDLVVMFEHTDSSKHSTMSGIANFSAGCGLLLSKACAFLYFKGFLLSWRLPLIIISVLGVFVFMMRRIAPESSHFTRTNTDSVSVLSLLLVLRKRYVNIIDVFFVSSFFVLGFSFLLIFLPNTYPYLESNMLIVFILYTLGMAIAGRFGDIWPQKTLMTLGALSFILGTCYCIYAPSIDLCSLVMMVIALSMFIGPMHAWYNDQFISSERCRSAMIGCALNTAFAYAVAIPIMMLLQRLGNGILYPVLYVTFFAFACVFCLHRKYLLNKLFCKNNKRK